MHLQNQNNTRLIYRCILQKEKKLKVVHFDFPSLREHTKKYY